MKNAWKNCKGMTLIELIVALAITSIILVAVFMVMVTGIRTNKMNLDDAAGQQVLRSAMTELTRSVRNAPTGTVSVASGALKVGSNGYSVSGKKELKLGSTVIAEGISAIYAVYTDSKKTTVQVDLVSSDGNTLSTKIRVN